MKTRYKTMTRIMLLLMLAMPVWGQDKMPTPDTVYLTYTIPSVADYDTLTVADIYELFGGIPNSLHFWFGEITRNYRTYMVFHYELLTPSDTLYPVPEWKRGR